MSIGTNTTAAEKLTSLADRMERLLDEIDALREDLRVVKTEAKSDGFNVRALTRLVAIRRKKGLAEAEAALLNDLLLYAHATGTPIDVVPIDEPLPAPARRDRPAAAGGDGDAP